MPLLPPFDRSPLLPPSSIAVSSPLKPSISPISSRRWICPLPHLLPSLALSSPLKSYPTSPLLPNPSTSNDAISSPISAGSGHGFVSQRRESRHGSIHRPRPLLSPALSPPPRRRSLSPRDLRSRPRRPRRLLYHCALPIQHQAWCFVWYIIGSCHVAYCYDLQDDTALASS